MSDQDQIPLRCVATRQETPLTKSYSFAPAAGNGFEFSPGQFLNLTFTIEGEEHVRSYTVSSSSLLRRNLTITVKRADGGRVSNWLFEQLSEGDTVLASEPRGMFSCGLEPSQPILLLTAGSGITPAASMLRSLADQGSQADVTLIHFADSPEQMIFREEMAHWARGLPRARIIPVVTRPRPFGGWVGVSGRISRDLLAGLVPDLAIRQVYCCGPVGFMDVARTFASELGVGADRFLTESFFNSSDNADETPSDTQAAVTFEINFNKSGMLIKSDPSVSVLKAAMLAGVRLQSSCGKGLCGTCRVKLKSGKVEMKHQGGIRQREIDQGFILACCSKPLSNLVIEK
jgi:glycine betaine catabolism B